MLLYISRALAAIFAVTLLLNASSFVSYAVPCATQAREAGANQYEIDCPIDSDCTSPALCDVTSFNLGGGVWTHWCECDDGTAGYTCNGYMLSTDPDPLGIGYDVTCFPGSTCPVEGEHCDENQLDGVFKTLCRCL